MKKDITNLFVFIDDFCKAVDEYSNKYIISSDKKRSNPTRITEMTTSEILTITLLFHQSPCKNFKYYYKSYVQLYKAEFPKLVSYERFVILKKRVLKYMAYLLNWLTNLTKDTGINFIDSSSVAVCHNKRISRNKVFKGCAKLGKSTKGWFFGFKLHLVINENGEIHSAKLTTGSSDDRTVVPGLTKSLKGLIFGDKGYISTKLFNELFGRGLKLVTGIKKTMQNKLMPLMEKLMLRKRSLVETVFDFLKNKFEIEHTRHRSVYNFLVHILSVLIVYCLKTSKPSIKNNFSLPA